MVFSLKHRKNWQIIAFTRKAKERTLGLYSLGPSSYDNEVTPFCVFPTLYYDTPRRTDVFKKEATKPLVPWMRPLPTLCQIPPYYFPC